MNGEIVAKNWVFSGLSDLYFGFQIETNVFSDYALFFEIMGLEKFLKAVFLFYNKSCYEGRPDNQAIKILNDKAKSLGHDIEKILKGVESHLGENEIKQIMNEKFDNYSGIDLMKAVAAGYQETRYPYPVNGPISDSFQIEGTNLTSDPLCSSGITKFIYRMCNLSYQKLISEIDFCDVLSQFKQNHEHRDSFRRFSNTFLKNKGALDCDVTDRGRHGFRCQ